MDTFTDLESRELWTLGQRLADLDNDVDALLAELNYWPNWR